MACTACGYDVPSEFAFCPKCGQRLAVPAPPAAASDRRPVTVLFADLSGFTALSETLDPEDLRALQVELFDAMSATIQRLDGFVEKFVGDAVMAVFGAPVAHEEDPERAVRAALRILDAIDELNDETPGLDLAVRAAVNTGDALVSLSARAERGEGIARGDVVDPAA